MTVNELIARLSGLYGEPAKARAGQLAEEYTRQLGRYEGEILGLAYADVMDDWTERYRPLPAVFRKACAARSPHQQDAEQRQAANMRERAAAASQRSKKIRDECRALAQRTIENAGGEIERRAGPARWNAPPYRMRHIELDRRGIIVGCVRDYVAKVAEPTVRHALQRNEPLPYVYAVTDFDWETILLDYDRVFSSDRATPASRVSGFVTPAGAMRGETNADWRSRAAFVPRQELEPARSPGPGPGGAPEPPPISGEEFEAGRQRGEDQDAPAAEEPPNRHSEPIEAQRAENFSRDDEPEIF